MKKLKISEKKLLLLINLAERRYLATAAATSSTTSGQSGSAQSQKSNLASVTKLNQVYII